MRLGRRLNSFRKGKPSKGILLLARAHTSQLIAIQCGPGAAILPADVSRIHLDFAMTAAQGHLGAKMFWKENLPRLKYHNPSIPMIVNRHDQNSLPPTMTIYFRKPSTGATAGDAAAGDAGDAGNGRGGNAEMVQPSTSWKNLSKAQPPTSQERIVTIDMANKHSSHILDFFLAETRAVPLQPNPDEIAEMQDLEALRRQGELDRQRVSALRAEKKKEEDMLKRARAAGGVAEQEGV